MRITRIDIEGRPGYYATISRKQNSNTIEVTILTPEQREGEQRRIHARSDEQEFYRQAAYLHQALMGGAGTNSDVHEYYTVLLRLAD